VNERRQVALMFAPYAFGALLLFIAPALYSWWLSLTDADLLTTSRFIGLGNFVELAGDEIFREVLWRSALFVLIAVPVRLFVAVGLALLLYRARAGRTAAFLPSVVPDAAWAAVWIFLLNPVYGPLNWLLGLVRVVTLPLMAPVLALLATRDVAVSLQATFTATYLLTDGGPDRATLLLPIYSFDMGFELLRYGYGSAMMLLGFLGCLALGVAQWFVVKRWRLGLSH
jgi:ABC-type sugar transport system permease subunit